MANKQLLQAAGDGTAVPAGYVGEELLSVRTLANWTAGSTAYGDVATITLSAGVWKINGFIQVSRNSVTFSSIECRGAYTSTAGNSVTGTLNGLTLIYFDGGFTTSFSFFAITMPEMTVISDGVNLIVKDGSNTTYSGTQVMRLKGDVGAYSSGTPQIAGYLRAVRIA